MSGKGYFWTRSKAYKERGGLFGVDKDVVETEGFFYGDGDTKEESVAAILGASSALESAASASAISAADIKIAKEYGLKPEELRILHENLNNLAERSNDFTIEEISTAKEYGLKPEELRILHKNLRKSLRESSY